MSWWIYLQNGDTAVEVKRHQEGGTYQVGGADDAVINVTYNYGNLFRFPELDGKTGSETLPMLDEFLTRHGMEEPSNNYWDSTPGNVVKTIRVLQSWALQYPDAKWSVH